MTRCCGWHQMNRRRNGQRSQLEAKEAADKKRRSRREGRDGGGSRRGRNYSPPRDKRCVTVMNLSCGDVAVPSRDLIRCPLSGSSERQHKTHTQKKKTSRHKFKSVRAQIAAKTQKRCCRWWIPVGMEEELEVLHT